MKRFFLILLVSLGYSIAGPVTVVLQNGLNGYRGTMDSYIMDEETVPVAAGITRLIITASCCGQAERRALIRFDLASGIPEAAVISDAKLSLYCYDDKITDDWAYAMLYKITEPWSDSGVTWYDRRKQTKWNTSGVVEWWTQEVVDEVGLPVNGTNKWQDYNVTEAVKAFTAVPVSNNGFMLFFEGSDEHYYHSSNAADVSLRPKLEITYTLENVSASFSPARQNQAGFSVTQRGGILFVSSLLHGHFEASLVRVDGKSIQKKIPFRGTARVDLNSVPVGVYLVTVSDGNQGIFTDRIYINK